MGEKSLKKDNAYSEEVTKEKTVVWNVDIIKVMASYLFFVSSHPRYRPVGNWDGIDDLIRDRLW